ncbi:16S rRNA (guanine(966)-N(2))-methyltransferase RsmD [Candidatus Termititenax persephonae]|uniref:16S rRNA (Guanine(966)-N(2))-methyltransferase RsmD n=1 Tax=Candidatus Termititenax persephonae TaxID=2218525 RepID=A0A388TIP0_9BACT|nr:16S rRNA (guanine(966)-N(2))-methyltransferase RsmD [Candidatus Termititenax persephonae]
MRIIAGQYRHRLLDFPRHNSALRPTKDMVREALFSIIGARIVGARFLDLYAGTGALGLEAISRGAREAVFIDQDLQYARANVQKIGCRNARLYRNDARRALRILQTKQEAFDIIFLDPPYQDGLLAVSACFAILRPAGLLIAETADEAARLPPDARIADERRYGSTKILFLERQT